MKTISVILLVDEEACMQEAEQPTLDEAIAQELGWLHDSGMLVQSWSYIED